jgi:phosphoenolpyruvate phosphomutase
VDFLSVKIRRTSGEAGVEIPLLVNTREDRPMLAASSRKTTRLRGLLHGPSLSFLMEAHNGLSARIAEEAGFPGVWASGLSISASLGVRDNNEASWTQVLDVVEFMSDATRVPILLDGDTGFGNFNSVRRLIRKLEQRGVAGVCLEDKRFPKTNSFLKGTAQPLAEVEEFCGKIRAAKDTQQCPDFVVVARVESFIAGRGLDEALRRAEAYHEAGADAILIHSARSQPGEILSFKREWGGRLPVVIVPTKYYTTPTQVFRDAGFSVVIWANHLMRSALAAMQRTARELFTRESLHTVEPAVAPLAEVFRLQNAAELEAAEKRYLPTRAPDEPDDEPLRVGCRCGQDVAGVLVP